MLAPYLSRENGPALLGRLDHPSQGRQRGWWEGSRISAISKAYSPPVKRMVIERRNFQRVYDFTHRVMPQLRTMRDGYLCEQAEAIMLRNSACSLGIFARSGMADYYRCGRPSLPLLLKRVGRTRVWWCRLTLRRWAKCDSTRDALALLESLPPVGSPQATAPCFRLSIRLYGIANELNSCLALPIGWSAIPRAETAVWLFHITAAAPGKTGWQNG